MVTSFEVNEPNALFDALTLYLSGRGEILGAHEVRRRLLLPGDLAGWLHEGCEGLTRETGERLPDRGLVAVLKKELADEVGADADGAVVSGLSQGAGSEPIRSDWDCPTSGITDVT